MKKQIITVPNYIRYISQWKEYSLPHGHCIVDKGVTGCGYTEFCLTNKDNIVLCSPRKLLLRNKSEQHQGDRNILYLENNVSNFQDSKSFEEKSKDHILFCNPPFGKQLPCKILVTYDSMFRVSKVLKELGLLEKFYFIVDEFQSIFLDSYFKADVEFDFIDYLQDCPNVIYLSATPMMAKYLEKIPEFKDLLMYELDWSKTSIVENIILKRKFTNSLSGECSKIILNYLEGKYEMTLGKNNNLVFSKEAVFYFNSISDIIRVIKKNKLLPSQVNIICADTKENKVKLSKLSDDLLGFTYKGEKFEIGKVPMSWEINKMFTFCTKTAYIGSDFHSDNARSFVFADPNISSLALDISLDLPQIAGRQRDDSNPFKNEITIFYRTLRKSEIKDRKFFENLQQERKRSTNILLTDFKKLSPEGQTEYLKKLRSDIKVSQYSGDFVSISSKTGEPVYNSFIEIANERAWEVSQEDYQDKISVTKSLETVSDNISNYLDEYEKIAQDFLDNHFYKTGIFYEKLKLYCEFMDAYQGNTEIEEIVYHKILDDRYRRYYRYYGTSGCRAYSFKEKLLSEGMLNVSKESEIKSSVLDKFKDGELYTLKEIKETLKNIYRDLGVTKTPKATDLGEYFKLIRVKFTDTQTKKRVEGFKLGSRI